MSISHTAPGRAHRPAQRPGLHCRATVLLVAAMLSTSALAADAPLTLGAAQRMAVERSRQLAGQDYAASAARDMAVAAGQLPDPVLKVGIDNLPVNGPDQLRVGADSMTMRRIGLSQELIAGDKRRLRAGRLELDAGKSLAEKAAAIASIERNTAIAWLDRYYLNAMATLVAEEHAQARQELEAADGAYRGGRGSHADLIGARSAVVKIADKADELARRVRSAGIMLARWTGTDAESPLAGQPGIDQIGLDPTTLEQQLNQHPELAVAAKAEQIAVAEVQLARADRRADWTVELAYQQRGGGYSNMVSFGVSVPLQWDRSNRQDRELSARLAGAAQARAERDELLRAHVAETRALINEWDSHRARLERYRRELLPLARQRSAAVLAGYRGGKASLASVLAARREETELRLQTLQLEADAARLWAQLNFLFPTQGARAHTQDVASKDAK